jgi:hypothetical protein
MTTNKNMRVQTTQIRNIWMTILVKIKPENDSLPVEAPERGSPIIGHNLINWMVRVIGKEINNVLPLTSPKIWNTRVRNHLHFQIHVIFSQEQSFLFCFVFPSSHL